MEPLLGQSEMRELDLIEINHHRYRDLLLILQTQWLQKIPDVQAVKYNSHRLMISGKEKPPSPRKIIKHQIHLFFLVFPNQ